MGWLEDTVRKVSDFMGRNVQNNDPTINRGQYAQQPRSTSPTLDPRAEYANRGIGMSPPPPPQTPQQQQPQGAGLPPGYKLPHQREGHVRQWDPVEFWGAEPRERPTNNPYTGNKMSYAYSQVPSQFAPANADFGPPIDPYRLYYSPDQVADEKGNLRPGLSPFAPYRGMHAYEMAHGYALSPLPMDMGGYGGGGGGAGGRGYGSFDYNRPAPAQPSLERIPERQIDMTDPMPPPERTPAPETYQRDIKRYEKLLGS